MEIQLDETRKLLETQLREELGRHRQSMCLHPNNTMGKEKLLGIIGNLGWGDFGHVVKACYPLQAMTKKQSKKRVAFFFTRKKISHVITCSTTDSIVLAIKVQKIKKKDVFLIDKTWIDKLQSHSSFWCEYVMLYLSSLLVKERICPFFNFFVDYAFCPIQKESYLFMTCGENSLYHYLEYQREKVDEKFLFSMIMQVCIALYALFACFQMVHSDIGNLHNILYHTVPINTVSGWKFKLKDREFIVPNAGLLFFVNDFGTASIKDVVYHPSLKHKLWSCQYPRVFYKKYCDVLLLLHQLNVNYDSDVLNIFNRAAKKILVTKENTPLTIDDYEKFIFQVLDDKESQSYLHIDTSRRSSVTFNLDKKIKLEDVL